MNREGEKEIVLKERDSCKYFSNQKIKDAKKYMENNGFKEYEGT